MKLEKIPMKRFLLFKVERWIAKNVWLHKQPLRKNLFNILLTPQKKNKHIQDEKNHPPSSDATPFPFGKATILQTTINFLFPTTLFLHKSTFETLKKFIF